VIPYAPPTQTQAPPTPARTQAPPTPPTEAPQQPLPAAPPTPSEPTTASTPAPASASASKPTTHTHLGAIGEGVVFLDRNHDAEWDLRRLLAVLTHSPT